MSAPARYSYALARPFDATAIAALRGVDTAPVDLIRHRDIVAVTSPMPADVLDEAALQRRLEDLEDLEALARAHHAVVAAVAMHAATIPLRLATIHRGDQRVSQFLQGNYEAINATLDRLAGRIELGVKVFARRSGRQTPPTVSGSSVQPGRDYLRARRGQRIDNDNRRRRATDAADALEAALSPFVIARRLHRPQPTGRQLDNILNAAYLVESGRAQEISERAGTFESAAAGITVEVTGPWPAYSFAAIELGAAS